MGKIWQENNTFSPVKTTLKDFERYGIYYGDEIIDRFANAPTSIGGFIKAAEEERVELIPTIRALSWPGGRVKGPVFGFLKDQLLAGISEADKIDGVLFDLHGAMVAEGVDDADGYLLEAIRRQVGETVPIVVSLDLHANITSLKIRSLSALVAYHTCPHIDMFETSYKAAKILFSTVRGKIYPTIGWRKIPMIAPAEKQLTYTGPFAKLFRQIEEVERRDDVVSANLFAAQPWIDVPELGWSTVIVTNNDLDLANKLANQLARSAWNIRHDLLVRRTPIRESIKKALSIKGGPVILSDSSDSTGAGAPGDSTAILKTLLEMNVTQPSMLPIVDSEAVKKAIEAGIGEEVTLEVGGKLDNIYSKPVKVTGRVTKISDGRLFIESPVAKGVEGNLGRTVVLEVNNIYLLLTEATNPGHDPGIYRSVGLEPKNAKIVVVKSIAHFRAAYESFAKEIIYVDAPGLSTSDIATLPFKKAPRPLFPLDKELQWK